MMPLDRMPSVTVGILVPVGAEYDSHHHWRDSGGSVNASVRFDAGGYSNAHIQGQPTALRELAAALHLAADQADAADQTDATDPTDTTRPTAVAVGS
jgi:hypothetical protein